MDLSIEYTGTELPKIVKNRYGRSTSYFIPYNIVEDNGAYTYRYVSLSQDDYNYGGLVDAIIGVKYSLADSLAILNNYLYDNKNKEYKKEFEDLQAWRTFAKEEAKRYF